MYEREYEKLLDFMVSEFPESIGRGCSKNGESAADVAIRMLQKFKSMSTEIGIKEQMIDLEAKRDKLINDIDLLSAEISSIDYQLSCAIQKKVETGKYSSVKWFTAAKNAKKAKRAEISKIQRELQRINSEIKNRRATTYERHFVNSAKEILREDVYASISKLTFDRISELITR